MHFSTSAALAVLALQAGQAAAGLYDKMGYKRCVAASEPLQKAAHSCELVPDTKYWNCDVAVLYESRYGVKIQSGGDDVQVSLGCAEGSFVFNCEAVGISYIDNSEVCPKGIVSAEVSRVHDK
ncbi:hypothetical protein E4U42_000984 [Claviceps africana]|uniref:Uncharacterized protein n=1 Tax=Claviceps africana TaxID=83212 RepID=A0A8K0JB36_9HYPO|nr:hypothetical protein E4U42_000984 [Claviceps africana]